MRSRILLMPQTKTTRLSKKQAFLAAYRATASVAGAARATRISRHTHHDWMKVDANYRAAFETVQDEAGQTLEDEAVRRAYEGVKRPIFYGGKPMKTGRGKNARTFYEVEYSDQLLLALLKRFRPKLYREHVAAEVTGSLELIDRLTAGRKRVIEFKQQNADSAERPAGT